MSWLATQWTIKRVTEWLATAVLFVPLLLVMGLIALAVKWDSPGPVLYIQDRLGRHGRVFRMYKFRSLCWQPGSSAVLNEDGSTRVDGDDGRLTRTGKFLRRGWDELPQLVNILKVEMALIGPRPDEPFHRAYYTLEEERKLSVLPGITGLPQATGRNNIPWKERIRLDLQYIDNYSLWLDCKIAWHTACLLLGMKGAPLEVSPKAQLK